jgi:hypothetical protein
MEEETVLALRLAKEGFGSIESLLAMPADLFIDALEYSGFLSDYQDAHLELNAPKK